MNWVFFLQKPFTEENVFSKNIERRNKMDERQTFATAVNKYAKEVFEKADKKDPASVAAVAELIKAMKGIFY